MVKEPKNLENQSKLEKLKYRNYKIFMIYKTNVEKNLKSFGHLPGIITIVTNYSFWIATAWKAQPPKLILYCNSVYHIESAISNLKYYFVLNDLEKPYIQTLTIRLNMKTFFRWFFHFAPFKKM